VTARSGGCVVLDVDGTLVDSERDGHRVAFNQAFEQAGLDDHWDPAAYGPMLVVTGGRRRLLAHLLATGRPAAEAERLATSLHRRKTEIVRDLAASGAIRPRAGAEALLDRLEADGVELAVATTGSRAWVEPLLARCFGAGRFGVTVTGTEVTALKPDPAAYLEVLRLTSRSATSCVAVEDSGAGVLAAVGAGIACVAVPNDYTRNHDLSAAVGHARGLDDPDLVSQILELLTPDSPHHRPDMRPPQKLRRTTGRAQIR
jgi:HAD superfamily hydrolase (TIGR01509 family)